MSTGPTASQLRAGVLAETAARELAEAVKHFAEHAPGAWDGGDLGYEVGGLWTMANDLLTLLNGGGE